jgi:two-component system sensor histidine kinase KdpD
VRIREQLASGLRSVAPFLLALGAIPFATGAVFVLGPQQLTNAAMLYLAAVLVSAVVAGRGPAVAASVAAFFTFNFFFTEPRYTFTVQDPSVLLVLFTFLLVAVVTSQLAAAQRSRAEDAEAREREARLLHDISDLLGGRPFKVALEGVAERIRSELALRAVAIDLSPSDLGVRLVAAGDEAAVRTARTTAATASVLSLGESASAERPGEPGHWLRVSLPHGERRGSTIRGLTRVPIRGHAEPLGNLILLAGRARADFGHRDARLLATAASQLGLAVEQERLRRQATEAEVLRRSNQLKNALLNAVSHDLRTPLSSIVASAGTLRMADVEWSVEERRDFAGAIELEAERLNRIVGNLLDLSRIQGGALTPTRDWHDPALLVRSAVERLRPLLDGHRLVVDIPADLPAVLLDPVEIDQVVSNLVENAAKYSPPGEPILVSAAIVGQELRVSVDDHGAGLPAGDTAKLFEPFYRAPGSHRVRGSGLGLAVARGLVTAHGGRIWAENRPEGGARFSFTLPLSRQPVEASE